MPQLADAGSDEPDQRLSTSCPTGTIVATAGDAILLAPASCKKWSCDPCGKRKTRLLAHRIALSPGRRFLTLTMRPQPNTSPQSQLDALNDSWRSLWKRIRRAHGPRALGYVKIVELHKSGRPHLHLCIATPFIHQRWLSRNWAELTGSPIVDIRLVKSERGIARYLSKYLTKSLASIAHRRRWSQSSKFLPPTPPTVLEEGELPWKWRFARGDVFAIGEQLAGEGWTRWHERLYTMPPRGPTATAG